jgi:hypothetical protein
MSSVPSPQLAPSRDDEVTESRIIANLTETIARLEARVAKLEQPPAQWLPLKAAAHDCGVEYETARTWAVGSLIEARREGARWFVNVVSLRAREAMLVVPRRKSSC